MSDRSQKQASEKAVLSIFVSDVMVITYIATVVSLLIELLIGDESILPMIVCIQLTDVF